MSCPFPSSESGFCGERSSSIEYETGRSPERVMITARFALMGVGVVARENIYFAKKYVKMIVVNVRSLEQIA